MDLGQRDGLAGWVDCLDALLVLQVELLLQCRCARSGGSQGCLVCGVHDGVAGVLACARARVHGCDGGVV